MLLEQLVLRLPHPHPPKWPHPLSLTLLCLLCQVSQSETVNSVEKGRECACTPQQVVFLEQSTVQTSTNTHGAHNSLSPHWAHTHTDPSSTSTGTGGSAPPHMLSGSANDHAHVTLLTVPGTMTFALVNTFRGAERRMQGDVCAWRRAIYQSKQPMYQSPTQHLQLTTWLLLMLIVHSLSTAT